MKKNRHSLILGLGLAAGLLALFSCAFLETLQEKEPVRENVFNHKVHVAVNEMDCASCHAGAESEARAGMPAFDTCLACHEGAEKGSKIAASLAVLQGRRKGGKALWQMVHPQSDLLFDHKSHTALLAKQDPKSLACKACHGDVGSAEGLRRSVISSMASCMECHEKGAPAPEAPKAPAPAEGAEIAAAPPTAEQMTECSFCHRVWRTDTQPEDHRKLWRVTHGEEVRFGLDEKRAYYCSLCHEKGYCEDCHRIEKPRSHTAFFRIRGHGIEAEINRDRCSTCHRQDYCVRCHQDTRPRDHTASWGGAPYRHCTYCHLDASNTRCGVCHKGSAAGFGGRHVAAGAPAYPKDATHAGNCTMLCHTSRHPDPGPVCTTCHK